MEGEGDLGDARRDSHRKGSTEDAHDHEHKCPDSRLAVDMMVVQGDDPNMGAEDAGSDGSDSTEVGEAARLGHFGGKDRSGIQAHRKVVAHTVADMAQASGS